MRILKGLFQIEAKCGISKKKSNNKFDVIAGGRRVGKNLSKAGAHKRKAEVEWFAKHPDKK